MAYRDRKAPSDVEIVGPLGAYQDLRTTKLRPVAQLQFVNGLNTLDTETALAESGTVTAAASLVSVSSGVTANGFARLTSARRMQYGPGQGVEARFSTLYTTAAASLNQWAGVGDGENALAVGYLGTVLTFLQRSGGNAEVQTLTITNGSTVAGGIVSIELNGVTLAVFIPNGLSIAEVASVIAAADYTATGGGWQTYNAGDRVIFVAVKTDARAGAYSFTDTGTTGVAASFVQSQAAVAATEVRFASTSWTHDKFDGSGELPVIDETQGNIWAIKYQGLGFGTVELYAEHPHTGKLILCHRLAYPNANIFPVVDTPNLPLMIEVDNGGTTTDTVVQSSSLGLFSDGELDSLSPRFSISNSKTTASGVELALLVIHVKKILTANMNSAGITVDGISLGNTDTTQLATFQLYKNPGLVGAPSWTDVDSVNSVVEVDVAATGVEDGHVPYNTIVGPLDAIIRDLTDALVIDLEPGDMLAVTVEIAAVDVMNASLSWRENN